MTIRGFKLSDAEHLLRIAEAMGYEIELPDPSDPTVERIDVVVDENDVPIQALIARKSVEYYYLVDPAKQPPILKWDWFKRLLGYSMAMLYEKGYSEVFAWVPPNKQRFAKRLETDIGASKHSWPCYTIKIKR